MTEATVNISLHRWDSRFSLLPITSRTPSGILLMESEGPLPSLASWCNKLVTSFTRKGLPSVWACTAATVFWDWVEPVVTSISRPTSSRSRPDSNNRWKRGSRTSSPRVSDRGWRRESSTFR